VETKDILKVILTHDLLSDIIWVLYRIDTSTPDEKIVKIYPDNPTIGTQEHFNKRLNCWLYWANEMKISTVEGLCELVQGNHEQGTNTELMFTLFPASDTYFLNNDKHGYIQKFTSQIKELINKN
jgi:hypothetical protein